MTIDKGRPRKGSQRPLERPSGVAFGELRALKEFLYELYVEAGTPTVADIARWIRDDDGHAGSPSKDAVHRIIASAELPAGQADVMAVASVLAQEAGWDAAHASWQARRLWVTARLARPLGTPVPDLDPFALEVHRAITLSDHAAQDALPRLPLYVERDHDTALRMAVDEAIGGRSLLVTLVGESSTGKTRACWESLRRLPDGWRVWHPYDPTRPEAALGHLEDVRPRTVVWLNEAQHYLLAPDARTSERVAARLRTVLSDRDRRPVLVLATMWPRYWEALTSPPSAGAHDLFAQQRDLLTGVGRCVTVPSAFTERDIAEAHGKATEDPRLARAVAGALDGEVTQFLAGVPALMARYACAPPGAAALIRAAMDFRRLGHGPALPRRLLAEAAQDYLTDRELDALGHDWLDAALAYCAEPCRGVPGPLTRIRRGAGAGALGGTAYGGTGVLGGTAFGGTGALGDTAFGGTGALGGTAASGGTGALGGTDVYRLADYLQQHGGAERRLLCPPASFWEAAARHAVRGDDLVALAAAARARGRLRHSTLLYRAAVDAGSSDVLLDLADLCEGSGALGEARKLYEERYEADGRALWDLVRLRELTGDPDGAEELANEAARKGDAEPLAALARLRHEAGDEESAERLVAAAARTGRIRDFADLARTREEAGDTRGAENLARAALRKGSAFALTELVRIREKSGDKEGADRLVLLALDAGKVRPAARLARLRERSGDTEGAARLLLAAARAGSVFALTELARLSGRAGDTQSAERALRAAAAAGSTYALTELARQRDKAGDDERAAELYQAAAELGNTDALATFALLHEVAGNSEIAESLACRAADGGSTFALVELVWVRERAQDRARAESLALTAQRAGNSGAIALIARLREEAGDKLGAEELVRRYAASGTSLVLHEFLRLRESGGDREGAERLAHHGGSRTLAGLAQLREDAGLVQDAERLYELAADRGDTRVLTELARLREEAGDLEGAERLARRAAHAGHAVALAVIARLRADAGLPDDARRLCLAAADAGYGDALDVLVRLARESGAPDTEALCRYGLAPDGTTSQPW
ncbi:hypothetical protein [Streptomyces sp. NPDC047928]|uniref:hypothetical protein n=1 Tax=unclassified Streptomyces TaxID=2593676 RepID=UPI00371B205C